MKELTLEDIVYEAGFPANIDTGEPFVVQISTGNRQSVVLYTCNIRGWQVRGYLPLSLGEAFFSKIYCFNCEES